MSRFWFTLVIFTISVFCSCANHRPNKDIDEFMGQQIIISRDWHTIWRGRDTLLYTFSDTPIKLVVWFDSLNCATCQIARMYEWNEIITYADSFEKWFNITFLFTPNMEEFYAASMMLKRISFSYPVFIDREATFIKQNPNLPQNSQLHTFLLDKNNQVVIMGSPLHNSKLWELYKNTIQNMIDNDGVYVER